MSIVPISPSSGPEPGFSRRGVTWTSAEYVCMHKRGRLGKSGGMIPQGNFVKIRCFEIVSEAIFGQKQSGSSYMGRREFSAVHIYIY